MRRECRNSFPTKQGKDPSSRDRRRKRGSPGCVRNPRASSRVDPGTRSGCLRKGQSPCEFHGGLSGFLSRRCRGLRPCVETGPEPEDSSPVLTWILGCSRLTMGPSGTRSGGLRKGQSPCEFLGGLSGFLSRRCRGLRPCVESGPEPEDSSPVLTWILGCSRRTWGTLGTRSGGLRKGQFPCEFLGGLSGFLSRRCRVLRPCVESGPVPEDSSPVLTWILGCSRLTTVTSGTCSCGLRKGQSPCEFLGGLSGFLSRRCRGLRPCVETGPEPEDSSPVLTWILGKGQSPCEFHGGLSGFLSRRCRGLRPCVETGPEPEDSSPVLTWILGCSRLTMGPSGTRSGGLRKGQSPCEFLGGLSGFLSRRCRGLRPCVESGPEPEDSSPVLTWILGCCRLTTGISGNRSGGLRKGQSPCEFLEGLSGYLSRRCRGLRPCVKSGPEHEDSSPVLTWILGKGQSPCEFHGGLSGFLSRRCRGLRPCVETGPEPEDSSPVLTWILGCSRLTMGPSGTRSGGLRKGQSPWLSHVHTWWESILGLNLKAVRGKQVPLEWTDTSGGLLDGGTTLEFLSPFLWRAPTLEMRRECREFFPYETGKGSLISS
ncbi:hypothetical protein MJG53_000393 [Ovis ammon polii x Ovis aries]|nr:hypothetical protein MJG53_000393 [Ovis ammon polii x Ovis aries]